MKRAIFLFAAFVFASVGICRLAMSQSPASEGIVVSPDGKPLAGARVALYLREVAQPEGPPIATATTGADGHFQLAVVRPERFVIVVHADGYALNCTNFSAESADPMLKIQMVHPAVLRLPILGTDGKPIPNARMGIIFLADAYSFFNATEGIIPAGVQDELVQTSDENGICTFRNVPRGFQVNIKPLDERFIREVEGIRVPDVDVADVPPLRLRRGVVVSGRVVRADTGAGVPQVNISDLVQNGRYNYGTGGKADANGAFRIPAVPAGEHTISATLTRELSAQLVAQPSSPVKLEPGEEAKDIEVRLVPGVEVRGKAIDSSTKTGIAGASISLAPDNQPGLFSTSVATVTGKDGSFVMKALPGQYMARISGLAKVGYLLPEPNSRRVVVSADQETTLVEFSCSPSPMPSVIGRAVDVDGKPVEGAIVTAAVSSLIAGSFSGADSMIRAAERSGGETVTDTDGRFVLPYITDNAVLSIRKDELRLAEPIQITARNRVMEDLKLLKVPMGSMLVHVVDSNGAAVKDAVVAVGWASPADMVFGERRVGRTDADGNARVGDLFTDRSYRVDVAARNYTYKQARELKVVANQETAVPTITLAKADGILEGILVDTNDQPIAGGSVRASGATYSNPLPARTDTNGHFRIEGLVAGTTVPLIPRVDGVGPGGSNGGWTVGTTGIRLVFDPNQMAVIGPVGGRGGLPRRGAAQPAR